MDIEKITTFDPVNDWISEKTRLLKAESLFLPAGNTLLPLYQEWEKSQPEFLSRIELYQVDDILSGQKAGLFNQYFVKHLPSYEVRFNKTSPKVADLTILGLGKNGHVAFHEPHLPHDFFFGEVELSKSTCESLQLESGTLGISYGVGAFLKSKAILLVISGSEKEDAVRRFTESDPTLPATWLKGAAHLTVYQI